VAWITLAESDVLERLNNAELDSYKAKVADLQADPLPGILTSAIEDARDYCRKQISSFPAAITIPPGLKRSVVDIAIYDLCKRIQTGTENQRKGAYDEAMEKLNLVASGEVIVEKPDPSDIDTTAGRWGSRPIITEPPHPDGADP
jgi:phage gp36-like protein